MDRRHRPSPRRRRRPRSSWSTAGRRNRNLTKPVAAALVVVTTLELGETAGPRDATSEGIAAAAPPGGAPYVARGSGSRVASRAPEHVGSTARVGTGRGALAVCVQERSGAARVAGEASAVAGATAACEEIGVDDAVRADSGMVDVVAGVPVVTGSPVGCVGDDTSTVSAIGVSRAGGSSDCHGVELGLRAIGDVVATGGPIVGVVDDGSGSEDAATVLRDQVEASTPGIPGPAVVGTPAERLSPPGSIAVPWPDVPPSDRLEPAVCVETSGARAIVDLFSDDRLIVGADYQRAYALPDGRVLWLFQDAFLPTVEGPRLVHNVGLVQSGRCFQLLRSGSADRPAPYLFPAATDPFRRWFWPLGGAVGADGRLHVFVAEMREHGPGYLDHTEPLGTWIVTIDPVTFAVVDERPAPDSTASLYGWSVVSWGDHTYLYAHCYRQFGWDPFPFASPEFRAHDWDCAADVTVARVPIGRFDATPRYWSGADWVDDAAVAAPVFPRPDRPVNPVQVAVIDGRLVAATKVGDWWGDAVHLDVSERPEGPWATYDTIPVEPRCAECNTYFASVLPYGHDGTTFSVAISSNTWRGDDLDHYEPSVRSVPMPPAIPVGVP